MFVPLARSSLTTTQMRRTVWFYAVTGPTPEAALPTFIARRAPAAPAIVRLQINSPARPLSRNIRWSLENSNQMVDDIGSRRSPAGATFSAGSIACRSSFFGT